jgi:hypothetical protein
VALGNHSLEAPGNGLICVTALDMSEKMITGIMHGFREFLCFGRSASTEMHKLESSAGICRNYGVVETEIKLRE